MEYLEFKNLCESISLGNKIVPKDNKLIAIINNAFLDIASSVKPLSLVSKDISDKPLKYIDDIYFIKIPKKITSVDDEIIIDDDLIFALAHVCCSIFVSMDNKAYHINKADEIKSNYTWNKYDN